MRAIRKTVLVLEWVSLPERIKDVVAGWHGFRNDVILPVRGEFDAEAYRKGKASLISYWEDQKRTNGFVGALEEFVKDYGLEFDEWFISQKFCLEGVDGVQIDVCW